MKKHFFTAAALFMAAYVFAYNPPVGGQTLFNLSSPTQLASASSCAGGGIFMPGADSIAFNPALPALEQRIQLDAAFSALISTNSDDDPRSMRHSRREYLFRQSVLLQAEY